MAPSSRPALAGAPRRTGARPQAPHDVEHPVADLGSFRLSVEHRGGRDGGPSLRVRSADAAGAAGREWLRFDCTLARPHVHLDPGGRDERVPLDPLADPVDQALDALRGDWRGWLARAGCADAGTPAGLEDGLAAAEGAMRNPLPDLDDLDVDLLHSRLSEKWGTHPKHLLPAWVAEMDYPLAEPIRLVLQRAVDRWDVGYPIDPRRTGVLEAFADRMQARFGWSVEPARTELLTDVVQGMYVALGAYAEAGDGAIVQTAIYPPFLQAVREMDRRLVESRARPGRDRFEFDLDALAAAADERTRVLLLCNPHNPTGRVFSDAELERLAELAVERDWVVVSDEIHADLVYPGRRHRPFATLGPDVAARTVTLTSATKAFNIPGLRCAVAHFGSEDLQRRFNGFVPRHVRGGLGILGLYATRAAWRHGQPWLDHVLAYLDGNRRALRAFVAERWPEVVCFETEATYLAWLDFRALDLPTTPGRFFAEHADVVVSDGRHFGRGFEGFARVNFATSRALLTTLLEAMDGALARR